MNAVCPLNPDQLAALTLAETELLTAGTVSPAGWKTLADAGVPTSSLLTLAAEHSSTLLQARNTERLQGRVPAADSQLHALLWTCFTARSIPPVRSTVVTLTMQTLGEDGLLPGAFANISGALLTSLLREILREHKAALRREWNAAGPDSSVWTRHRTAGLRGPTWGDTLLISLNDLDGLHGSLPGTGKNGLRQTLKLLARLMTVPDRELIRHMIESNL